jgi:hypothetical protein
MILSRILSFTAVSFLLIVAAACSGKKGTVGETKSFFDLQAFMNNEGELLAAHNAALSKTVTYNKKSESKTFQPSEINWSREFSSFSEADINKPAWRDSYKVSSTVSGDDSTVKYTCTDEELPVNLMSVSFNSENEVDSIYIETRQSNPLYETLKQMSYVTGKTIRISGSQHTLLLGDEEYSVYSNVITAP